MPRENSFSDSDGRSLTPDLSDAEDNDAPRPRSPTYSGRNQISSTPLQGRTTAINDVGGPSSSAPAVPRPSLGPSRPTQSPKDRFRSVARKVMALHRSTSMMVSNGVGAEPGIDPRRASADLHFGKIKQDCVIQILDYSSLRHSYGQMTNKEFVNFLGDPRASQREPWVKVRWINIGGLSWDVIKAVTLKYDLHPLALEDIFHHKPGNRSKADYYSKHLFIYVLCHELGREDDGDVISELKRHGSSAAFGSTLNESIYVPRSSSPEPLTEEDKMGLEDMESEERTLYSTAPNSRKSTMRMRNRAKLAGMEGDVERGRQGGRLSTFLNKAKAQRENKWRQAKEDEVKLRELKKGEKVVVKEIPFYIFLFRDGTVVTVHRDPDLSITTPIVQRLHQRDTGLRSSADPSLLVQSLLDLVVDKAVEVTEEYAFKIQKFERQILLKPQVSTVRNLHIFSEDLILLKRTLEPIKTLIYGLRRYDVDRCAALVDPEKDTGEPVKGYMTHKSKIYLADVFDHMEYVLTSLDMFAAISENLINYTFNMTSYEMNEVMRRLTLATIVFLPLTLLTGYFGMNFEAMWSVQQNSDVLFWEIAIPVMLVVIPLFLMPDIKRVFGYIVKRMSTKKAVKAYKTA